MFTNLENKHVEQIYNLQINNADEFGNNIWSRLEINDLIKTIVSLELGIDVKDENSITHVQSSLKRGEYTVVNYTGNKISRGLKIVTKTGVRPLEFNELKEKKFEASDGIKYF